MEEAKSHIHGWFEGDFYVLDTDKVEYIIEQAERVPELESHLSKNGNKYRNQNKRLRKELDRATRQRNKQQDKAILNQMTINLEGYKKEARERTLEGYKNLKNKQRERIEDLESENKRYRDGIMLSVSHFNQDEHVEGMAVLQRLINGGNEI